MGKYSKGDHVKIEIADERFGGISEWMWMLVDSSDTLASIRPSLGMRCLNSQ